MLYKFEVKVSEKDYYEFNKYHSITSPDVKNTILKWQLYLPMIFLIFLIFHVVRGDSLDWLLYNFKRYLLISLIWFFVFKPFITLYINYLYKRLKKKNQLCYAENAVIEFYDDSFTETTDDSTLKMQYSAIYKVRINENKAIYI